MLLRGFSGWKISCYLLYSRMLPSVLELPSCMACLHCSVASIRSQQESHWSSVCAPNEQDFAKCNSKQSTWWSSRLYCKGPLWFHGWSEHLTQLADLPSELSSTKLPLGKALLLKQKKEFKDFHYDVCKVYNSEWLFKDQMFNCFFLGRDVQSLQLCLALVLAGNAVARCKHFLCPTFQNILEEVFTASVNKQKYSYQIFAAHISLPLSYCIMKQLL